MNQTQGQSPGFAERVQRTAGVVSAVCDVLATSVVVFTRRDFGRRYFGLQAAAVIPLVLVYSLFWQGHDPRPLLGFLGSYLLMLAIARARSALRVRHADTIHSRYSGTPTIVKWPLWRGRLTERGAKQIAEPGVIAFLGICVLPYDEPLGWYLVIAACGSAMSVMLARAYERSRLADMRDQFMEQRHYAERFRDGGWQ